MWLSGLSAVLQTERLLVQFPFRASGIQSQYSEVKGIPVYQQRNCRNRNQGKSPICYSNKKNKGPRHKPNQGGKRPVLRKLYNIEERN